MKHTQKLIVSSIAALTLSGLWTSSFIEASGNGNNYSEHTNTNNQQSENNHHSHDNQKKVQNLTGEKFTTIAHRGASGYAPEHTFFSYDRSHNAIGASYIEIDLQMTKDGHLVAMHDETVDRTTNGTGRVDQYTLKELKQLDAGSKFNSQNPQYANSNYEGAKIPTLDEILERYGTEANYYIETKSPDVYPGMEEKLLDSLNKHHMLNQQSLSNGHVLVQSFSKESLLKMQGLNSNVPLIRLLDKGELLSLSQQDFDEIRNYAIGVGPEASDLTKQNVTNLKKAGLLVHPFTVNDPEDMKRLNGYGVDGVFTNYPDIYKQIISDGEKNKY
ncbi:glycerophosphodiester phosphodiesterase [Staphylococcus sp. GSSP0090]|nr:glycerophosphodiester phosphodiesterase [Staphylococcus sp. GSSP0090]